MYDTMYEKVKNDQSPFHQKVLRLNYHIPIGEVYKAITRCFQAVKAEETLIFAPDFLECVIPVTEEAYTVARDSFYQAMFSHVVPMGQKYPGARTGVFDQTENWYLRIFAEDLEDVSEGEFLCGNFELYAPDELLEAAEQAVAKTVEGHLLKEGAKKYIEEITEA